MHAPFYFAEANLTVNTKKITVQSFLQKISFLLFLIISNPSFCQQDSVLFTGDFNNGIIAQVGHRNAWRRYGPEPPKRRDHRWRLDSTIVRQGKYSLRVELRPGDTSRTGYSDRAEVIGMQDSRGNTILITGETGTVYLAFSIQLDSLWQPPRVYDTLDSHASVLQLHKSVGEIEDVSTGPAFSLQALDKFVVRTNTGNIRHSVRTDYYLSDERLKKGTWVDFVIKIKFSIKNNGEIMIWRRNENQSLFSLVLNVPGVKTLLYDSTKSGNKAIEHIWHTGYYRNRQRPGGVTNILWLDGYTMARTGAAAQFNAFNSVVVNLPGDNVTSCVSPVPIPTITNLSCDRAGSISLKTFGGPGPFQYAWQGPNGFRSSDQDIVAPAAGIYNVTIAVQGGCLATASYTVTDPCNGVSFRGKAKRSSINLNSHRKDFLRSPVLSK